MRKLKSIVGRYGTVCQDPPVMVRSIDGEGRLIYVDDVWLNRRSVNGVALPQNPRSGVARNVEYQTVKKNGEVIDLLLSPITERNELGDFDHSVAFAVDVTGRKRKKAAAKRLESALLRSQEMEAAGRVAAGIAHDVNNLLAAIRGFASLTLAGTSTEEPCYEYLLGIEKACERANSLVSQLSSFSRRQTIEPRVINLNRVISDLRGTLSRIIGDGVEMVTSLSPVIGRVKVDPNQFERVVMNLVVNACRAMPSGGVLKLETYAADVDEDHPGGHTDLNRGQYVVMAVKDNGTGMSNEVKSHLFEPFYTTKAGGNGSGLGLATCYGIIKHAGGTMDIESELGLGTVVRIYLPCVEERDVASGQEIHRASLTKGTKTLTRGSETLLAVDDEELVRNVLAIILRDQGYTVLEAASGAEALEIASQNPAATIDLLLTDFKMPDMDGAELAERLSIMRPGIKILVASGYQLDSSDFGHTAIASIIKPFTPTELGRTVRRVLDGLPVSGPE